MRLASVGGMRRICFARPVLALAAAGALVLGVPATALADGLRPEATPVVGIADGIGYSVTVRGTAVEYTATEVPISGRVLGVPIPGVCTSALIDAVAAAPIIGPSVIDTISGGEVDALALIRDLLESDAVVDVHLLRAANGAGTVSGTFENVPTGLYLVVSFCNPLSANPVYGATGAFVLGTGWNSGSTAGGGSSLGPA